MKKHGLVLGTACALLALAPTSTASAAPKGNAYGYWAGRLCDLVVDEDTGETYWENRLYSSRGACVRAEGQSLARGEWDPADWFEM
jgi:hypothetical protein